ncbi:hypothetical protein [Staphylococcus nepalensis]|uniref:hypothetical protein n=1 Tax=Staphylococcus nepalensis TaxID=214473 RepID=UPI0024B8383A|nr:hypothetical protein [Staphylococcus nepalensis]MDR5650005.1 hypothetical protein [Staphylococcus nepalensis]
MKKFLFLVLMFFLVLTACGSKEENKSKDETESKSLNKYDKIDNKKKKVMRKNLKTMIKRKQTIKKLEVKNLNQMNSLFNRLNKNQSNHKNNNQYSKNLQTKK